MLFHDSFGFLFDAGVIGFVLKGAVPLWSASVQRQWIADSIASRWALSRGHMRAVKDARPNMADGPPLKIASDEINPPILARKKNRVESRF